MKPEITKPKMFTITPKGDSDRREMIKVPVEMAEWASKMAEGDGQTRFTKQDVFCLAIQCGMEPAEKIMGKVMAEQAKLKKGLK